MSETPTSERVSTPTAENGGDRKVNRAFQGQGWKANLALSFESNKQRTFVRRRSFGPYNIQRPFYPEGAVSHVYLLHPPGGLVGGDSLNLTVSVAEHAHGVLTTPGASRFYRSKQAEALQEQILTINGGALDWLPQETIYFNGCRARTNTEIHLHNQAKFLGWELQCLGRPASQSPFVSGSITNLFSLYKQRRLVLRDRLHIDAPMDTTRVTGLRGADVHGLVVATPADSTMLELAQNILKGSAATVTLIEDCLLVRYLGSGAEPARALFVKLWQELRPLVMNRPAHTPRIWST